MRNKGNRMVSDLQFFYVFEFGFFNLIEDISKHNDFDILRFYFKVTFSKLCSSIT